MTEARYGIGIDTGGTYTDGALINLADQTVVATAKSATTHFDLSHGIALCLRDLFINSEIKPADIDLVAVSTTLATNAVVESKGDRVGLIVAGYARPLDLPVVSTLFVEGGHTLQGDEERPLDLDAVVRAVSELKGNVESYVVCSAMSIKNPAHEQVMAKAVSMIDPLPVFMSHEVSSRVGVADRAATAVLNARLRPVMESFLLGMQDALVTLGIARRVMIIRGDATAMDIVDTHRQAASTVASGPAATAWFGLSFAPAPDAVIIDIGGTTTDITMIKDGKPTLTEDGSLIGKWQTHVDAVKMSTVGAGGDSHALVDRYNKLQVGPDRVLPLSMAAATSPADWLGAGLKSRLVTIAPDLTEEQAKHDPILEFLFKSGPQTPEMLKEEFGMGESLLASHIRELVKGQLAFETGFTPTDALHVLAEIELGDVGSALAGATVLGAELGLSPEAFAREVLDQLSRKIEVAVLDHILAIETGKTLSAFYPDYRNNDVIAMDFRVKLPFVGIGAVSKYILPQVAERLGTTVVFPDHYEVGNALGAILMASTS
ncbi:MAG: hydantoinase/oxoprolinase family protein [Desulfobulbaceae bacterium]|jgi:N-methylhydantoinase A/oxoprolinase/acetone carboxylase beta subunit|nr:hydantoinase/oxoprolinase family protein [Desulfobulbaceae bacterium]